MALLINVFITISIMFCLGMLYNLICAHRPGIFPTKIILRKRAGAMAIGAVMFILLAMFFSIFK